MKALLGVALLLGAVAALLWWAPDVSATANCGHGTGASGNWCQGFSHTATGGGAGARCFALRTTNTAPTCTTTAGFTGANDATWEMAAGSCITLYWFEGTAGLSPPAVPNKVTIQLRFENTATIILTVLSAGADPSPGSTYSVCATDTGSAGGSARAGTYRVFLQAQKDNAPGGIGNYNVDSDGAAGGFAFDKGVLRGQLVVSSIDANAYPAGSTFAYGAAGDETVTVTSAFSTPNGETGLEGLATALADEATLVTYGQQASTVDVDTGSLAQGFTVDQTFPSAGSPYVGTIVVVSNNAFGVKWTSIATTGHGASIVRFSDLAAYSTTDINIDPNIAFDADDTGPADDLAVLKLGSSSGAVVSAFNRGETYYAEWYLLNARGEKLSRAMTHVTEDASAAVCTSHGSLTPTSNKYSVTVAIPTGGSCAVAATDPGSPRYLRATNTDQADRSGQVFSVSSLYYLDAHTQSVVTLDKDDFPTEDADEDHTFFVRSNGAGGDASDTIYGWCHVKTVRKDTDIDTSGSAVTGTLRDPTTTVRTTSTADTGSDGWTGSLPYLSSTPLGTWTWACTATFSGNTGTDTESITVNVEGGGGETLYTGVDPMTVHPAWKEGYLNETNLISITARFLDGTARLDAEDEMLVDVYDPSGSLVVTGDSPLEVGGGIYRYTVTETATPGDYLVVVRNTVPETMGGAASNAFTVLNATGNLTADLAALVSGLQDHRDNSLEIFGMSFNNLDFDGFLIVLAWFAMLLYCLVKFRVFAGFVSTLGLVEALIPTVMPGSFLGYLLLLIVAVWLEAVAGERIYAKYLNKKNKDVNQQ